MSNLRLIKAPNGYWHAHVRGAKHPFSLKTKSKEEAEAIVKRDGLEELATAKRIGALTPQFQQHVAHGRKTTLRQAFDQYMEYMSTAGYAKLTMHHVRTHLTRWIERTELGPEPVTAINERHIDRWINSTKSTSSYHTRVRYLNDIRSFFGWAHSAGIITFNPSQNCVVRAELLPQSKRVQKERLPFSDEEVAKILTQVKPGEFWHTAVLLAYETGLRMRDCCLLEKTCIVGRLLTVATVKSTSNTIVSHRLSDACIDSLKRAPGYGNDETRYVFPDVAENLLADEKRSTTYSQQFRRLCIKAGVEGKSFHNMRHTFAVRKKREERRRIFDEMLNELALERTASALGHKSTTTTKIYTEHTPQ